MSLHNDALILWECLDARQRGRLAARLKLNETGPAAGPLGPLPFGNLNRRGVPGYVDVGISQTTAEVTLEVKWKIKDDAWNQAQKEGATFSVHLHPHKPIDEHNQADALTGEQDNTISTLPVDSPTGTRDSQLGRLALCSS